MGRLFRLRCDACGFVFMLFALRGCLIVLWVWYLVIVSFSAFSVWGLVTCFMCV